MPNIKSAKKRVEISAKRKDENIKVKGTMKTAVKKAIQTNDSNDLNDAIKKIDKALKKGIIKKNTASRKKSKIMKNVNKAK